MKINLKTLPIVILFSLGLISASAAQTVLLNVSYDPTRELYQDYNKIFIEHWKKTTGENLSVKQSHGGSGKQARAVLDGLDADVVTLALAYDIDILAEKNLVAKDWQKKFKDNASLRILSNNPRIINLLPIPVFVSFMVR